VARRGERRLLRRRRRDYSCSLAQDQAPPGSSGSAQGSGSFWKHVPAGLQPYLDDEAAEARVEGAENQRRAVSEGAREVAQTPIQGSGHWRGRWRRDRRGPISRLMWIKRVEIFLAL